MEQPVILAKLDSLNRCLMRIKQKTPHSAQLLVNDIDLQDIISLNLSRAVQLSVDIGAHVISVQNLNTPQTMGSIFETSKLAGTLQADTAEKLKKSVGFRNIAVHEYENVNWEIVFTIITQHLADFVRFIEQIQQYLNSVKAE